MFYSVDRVDDKYAVLCDDDGETKELRLFRFEGEVKEGQVYRFENGTFLLDEAETNKRKEHIKSLENELFN